MEWHCNLKVYFIIITSTVTNLEIRCETQKQSNCRKQMAVQAAEGWHNKRAF